MTMMMTKSLTFSKKRKVSECFFYNSSVKISVFKILVNLFIFYY